MEEIKINNLIFELKKNQLNKHKKNLFYKYKLNYILFFISIKLIIILYLLIYIHCNINIKKGEIFKTINSFNL